jgi:predicted NBD/HSP70 family sugar kinase
MRTDITNGTIAVFDIGGTWFRWGRYDPSRGLVDFWRMPAINYLSHPKLSAVDLQEALADFIIRCVREMYEDSDRGPLAAGISLGAPINAHSLTVLGSGPLWGPTAQPFDLQARLHETLPQVQWHIVNDISALLAPYMENGTSLQKTLLITVSSGIGSRLYDHRIDRIPYDATHGIQGEIGHLVFPFELGGKWLTRRCECGGWNHLNAFSSGRGIAQTLHDLPSLSSDYTAVFPDAPGAWCGAGDEYRLSAFAEQLGRGNTAAVTLLDAFVTPLSRVLATALSMDPDIDRIVITGGVTHGLGLHYREALQRTFTRDGLYQITERDPHYLARRLHWEGPDDFAGLRGAGVYASRLLNSPDTRTQARINPGERNPAWRPS